MDVKTYIQQQMANARAHVDTVLKGLTDEQFNWLPPGTINPISAILVHTLAGEDFFIQTVLQGKPRCWETQEWGRSIGIQAPPGPAGGWDEFKTLQLLIPPVLAYQHVIWDATDRFLADLTPEGLDRQVNFAGRQVSVAEMLIISVVHTASHAGEIAAVKGMQGIQGLPF